MAAKPSLPATSPKLICNAASKAAGKFEVVSVKLDGVIKRLDGMGGGGGGGKKVAAMTTQSGGRAGGEYTLDA